MSPQMDISGNKLGRAFKPVRGRSLNLINILGIQNITTYFFDQFHDYRKCTPRM